MSRSPRMQKNVWLVAERQGEDWVLLRGPKGGQEVREDTGVPEVRPLTGECGGLPG